MAAAVLGAVCVASVVLESRFKLLPKPTSDGPVYENMAYHLSVGHGFWIDWHDPQWRELYEQSNERDGFQVYLDAPSQSMPMTGRPSKRWSTRPWFFIQLRYMKPFLSTVPNHAADRSLRGEDDMAMESAVKVLSLKYYFIWL